MRKILGYVGISLLALGIAGGCHQAAPAKVDFLKPLPEGMAALRKIPLEEYPDFGAQPIDPTSLTASIDNSLTYLAKPSSQAYYPYLDITHNRAVATLQQLKEICRQQQLRGTWDPVWFNQQIRDHFEVYKSVRAASPDGEGYTERVLFTGYCTPTYDASLTRTDEYQWPLYKPPDDLARDPQTMRVLGRKTIDGQVVPYYTRGEIETGGKLAGDELVWLKSRWQAYVITIQGSARLRLTDGKMYDVGFGGTNGYDYSSPGQQMVADGVMSREEYSSKTMAAYFAAHPEAMDKYLSLNKRYVFFIQHNGEPSGALGVPVTPFATIATDKESKDVYPRAMAAFAVTGVPTQGGGIRPFSNFLMDQDAGGAIRASGRADIYMGIGPQAEALAGQEVQEGALYYLAARTDLPLQPSMSTPPQVHR